ncbi:MAG: prepilin-type N-terminal cleavage/methylation domain-containing protein [Verrucomicrobia bacterium]|nr:prepilin-type N-terminal cleavage/methylation domain-containing protein [Verrucomicrobiota bacterium]
MRQSPRHTAGFTLIELLTVIAILGILAALLFPTVGSALDRAKRAADGANIREISKAAMIYAQDNNDRLPDPQNIPTTTLNSPQRAKLWPGIIARNGILNDPKIYFSKLDPFAPATLPISIINSQLTATQAKTSLDSTFTSAAVSPSYEFVGGLKTSDPATSPVVYTRGLQTNGAWSVASGTYKDVGGYIAFLGGNVEFFTNTATPTAVLTSNFSNRKIGNIQQAIPFNTSNSTLSARLWGIPPPGGTTLGGVNGTLAQRGQ